MLAFANQENINNNNYVNGVNGNRLWEVPAPVPAVVPTAGVSYQPPYMPQTINRYSGMGGVVPIGATETNGRTWCPGGLCGGKGPRYCPSGTCGSGSTYQPGDQFNNPYGVFNYTGGSETKYKPVPGEHPTGKYGKGPEYIENTRFPSQTLPGKSSNSNSDSTCQCNNTNMNADPQQACPYTGNVRPGSIKTRQDITWQPGIIANFPNLPDGVGYGCGGACCFGAPTDATAATVQCSLVSSGLACANGCKSSAFIQVQDVLRHRSFQTDNAGMSEFVSRGRLVMR